jgi:hypothetical protein
MKSRKKHYPVTALAGLAGDVKITMRKNLNADAMFGAIRKDFDKIADHRATNRKIPLVDALMSGFAMFSMNTFTSVVRGHSWVLPDQGGALDLILD